MSERGRKTQNGTPQWVDYLLLGGLLCIIIGVLLRIAAQAYPKFTGVASAIGYLGVFLILAGFFIQISIE